MRTTSRLVPVCAATVIAFVFGTPRARAQDAAGDKATGIAVFEDGKKLAAAGDWAGACPKFAEAGRLYPAAAIFLNLAECYEHVGKVASAWASWKEAEIMARGAGDTTREEVAVKRGQALAPTLPKLAIVVPPATRIPGLEVRRDGVVVGEGQYGSALPADAGQHTIEARAPGHKAWSTVVRIETNASAASVEIPALDAQAAPPPVEAPAPFWNTQRIAGTAVAGAGLVGMLVGAVSGAITLSKTSDAKAYCSATKPYCTPPGIADENSARTLAHVSDVGLAVGGAAVIAGLVTFFTAPSSVPRAPARMRLGPLVGQGRAGVVAEGRW